MSTDGLLFGVALVVGAGVVLIASYEMWSAYSKKGLLLRLTNQDWVSRLMHGKFASLTVEGASEACFGTNEQRRARAAQKLRNFNDGDVRSALARAISSENSTWVAEVIIDSLVALRGRELITPASELLSDETLKQRFGHIPLFGLSKLYLCNAIGAVATNEDRLNLRKELGGDHWVSTLVECVRTSGNTTDVQRAARFLRIIGSVDELRTAATHLRQRLDGLRPPVYETEACEVVDDGSNLFTSHVEIRERLVDGTEAHPMISDTLAMIEYTIENRH